jgi:hypothetical protein
VLWTARTGPPLFRLVRLWILSWSNSKAKNCTRRGSSIGLSMPTMPVADFHCYPDGHASWSLHILDQPEAPPGPISCSEWAGIPAVAAQLSIPLPFLPALE